MKKLLLIGLLLGSAAFALDPDDDDLCMHDCRCKFTSQSTFVAPEVFRLNSPVRISMFRPDFLYENLDMQDDSCWHGAAQAVVFGGKVTRNRDLARFFLPSCHSTMHVQELQGDPENTDILGQNIGINTLTANFVSKVTVRPHQKYIGLGLEYMHLLWKRDDGRALWFGIAAPIMHVRNCFEICEEIVNGGHGVLPVNIVGSPAAATIPNPALRNCHGCPSTCLSSQDPNLANAPVASFSEAMRQPSFCFGRIDNSCCDMRKSGIADLELRLGGQLVDSECCALDSYWGVIIPTGNRPRARFMWEPIIGNRRHFGMVFGNSVRFSLWHDDVGDKRLSVSFDFSGQYLFARKELRSFDVKNKPWSRYLPVYNGVDQAVTAFNLLQTSINSAVLLNTPGINVFTQELRVRPGFSRTLNTALIYEHCALTFEGGYNFYARQAECVELACPFNHDIAFRSILGGGLTDRFIQINDENTGCAQFANTVEDVVANFAANRITEQQLDLESAAHPAYYAHMVYASVGYTWQTCENPVVLSVGGSYEFGPDNAVLNRWTAWGKVSISF